jgi:ribonuclease III
MQSIEVKLGYKFRNPLLLAEALTHPSLAYESQKTHFDNQRLEFLGDSVLQLAITEHLYRGYPSFPEGQMTKLRARLVSRNALAQFAISLDLGSYILLGKGEEASGGRKRASTLADVFEALMGSIYLDAGYADTRDLVIRLFQEEIHSISESGEEGNPKGTLQEVLQAITPEPPKYQITGQNGPDHRRVFHAQVIWQNVALSQGRGKSKKEAEIRAALEAIRKRAWENIQLLPLIKSSEA